MFIYLTSTVSGDTLAELAWVMSGMDDFLFRWNHRTRRTIHICFDAKVTVAGI
jgi:hypothetical protein